MIVAPEFIIPDLNKDHYNLIYHTITLIHSFILIAPIGVIRTVTSLVLVPVDLPRTDEISDTIIDLLSDFEVILLGVYEVPDQTAPVQAREHDDGCAEDTLTKLATRFDHAGATVHSQVLFTHNRQQSIEQTRIDKDCDVILIPDRVGRMEWILVPIRGVVNRDRITDFLAGLANHDLQKVTLFHVAETESKRSYGQAALEHMSTELIRSGMDKQVIECQTVIDSDPINSITKHAKDYDAIVMGGTKPSVTERIFGRIPNQIGHEAGCPVFVISSEE